MKDSFSVAGTLILTKLQTTVLVYSFPPGAGYYRPFATRLPVLFFLLILTLTLIGITELACRKIPAHDGVGEFANTINGNSKLSVRREWVNIGPRQNSKLTFSTRLS